MAWPASSRSIRVCAIARARFAGLAYHSRCAAVTADLEGTHSLVDLKLRYDGTFNAGYGAKKQGEAAPVRIKGAFELPATAFACRNISSTWGR